jgi:hypothetical protein
MDFVTQGFSVNPWLKETRERLENELGMAAPHMLCAGVSGPSTIRIESDEHYLRVFNAERMRFLKNATNAKKNPFSVPNSRWSVFFYELSKSQAVKTRMEELMGWNEFHEALFDLEMWIIPWVKSFLATDKQREIYLKNYFTPGIEDPEAEDHDRIRASIAKLYQVYMESGLYKERNTFGKASLMDSTYLWKRLTKAQARTLGRFARTRAKKATYEPAAPFYSGIEASEIRVAETPLGSPGQPVMFQLIGSAKPDTAVAGYIQGVSPSGKTVVSFNQEGVIGYHEFDAFSTNEYRLQKLQRYSNDSSLRYFLPKENRYVSANEMYKHPESSDRVILEDGVRAMTDLTEVVPIASQHAWKKGDRVCFSGGGYTTEWVLLDSLASGYAVVQNSNDDSVDSRSWQELQPCIDQSIIASKQPVDSARVDTKAKKPRKRVRKSKEKWAFEATMDSTVAIGHVRGVSKRGDVVFTREKRRKAHKGDYHSVPESQVVIFTRPRPAKGERNLTYQVWSLETLAKIGGEYRPGMTGLDPLGVYLGKLPDQRWVIERNGRPEAFVPDQLFKIRKYRFTSGGGVYRKNAMAQSATGEFVSAANLGETEEGRLIVYFMNTGRISVLDPSQVRARNN